MPSCFAALLKLALLRDPPEQKTLAVQCRVMISFLVSSSNLKGIHFGCNLKWMHFLSMYCKCMKNNTFNCMSTSLDYHTVRKGSYSNQRTYLSSVSYLHLLYPAHLAIWSRHDLANPEGYSFRQHYSKMVRDTKLRKSICIPYRSVTVCCSRVEISCCGLERIRFFHQSHEGDVVLHYLARRWTSGDAHRT